MQNIPLVLKAGTQAGAGEIEATPEPHADVQSPDSGSLVIVCDML